MSRKRRQGSLCYCVCASVGGQRLGFCQRCQQGFGEHREEASIRHHHTEWEEVWRHGNTGDTGWLASFNISRAILWLLVRFVTKLLEDLVFFVCVVPNNGQDVLSVVTSMPNRERQKLMREQNILAQVSMTTNTFVLLSLWGLSLIDSSPTVCSVFPDLWYSKGSFHRSGWWCNTEAGGSGRPAIRSLQVHAETLLQGPAPLPTRLSQEPGRFPVSVIGLTLSVDSHHRPALWTTWWHLSFWHLSGSLILIRLIRWNDGSNADWGLLLSWTPMDYGKTLRAPCCIICMGRKLIRCCVD